MADIKVNGRMYSVDADPETPLLWVIRELLGMTGTKFGCGVGVCGACTIHLDGSPTRSCITPLSTIEDGQIVTIEGLSPNRDHPVQLAWIEQQVPQCGYCQSGMIMAAAGLLARSKNPTNDEIDAEITNICRCGTYQRIRKAIHLAASKS